MRKIDSWLNEYSESHQHPINKILHFISIPLIMMSVLILMIWSLQLIYSAMILIVVAVIYLQLSRSLFVGILMLVMLEMLAVYWIYNHVQIKLWIVSLSIFIIGWALQFLGHWIEGKKPSFLKNLIFLLIGPLWLVAPIYRLLRVKI